MIALRYTLEKRRGHCMKVRIAEHKQAVKKGDEKNGIAVHAHTTNHSID